MIRPAVAADVAALEMLVRDAYGKYIARNGKRPGPMGDDHAALVSARRVHVLDDGERIVGVLVLIPEPDVMLLSNVAVGTSAQGRGYGKLLMAFAERQARDAGYRAIRLYTQAVMIDNIALYKRLGYVETGRGDESGLTRVFMRKALQ